MLNWRTFYPQKITAQPIYDTDGLLILAKNIQTSNKPLIHDATGSVEGCVGERRKLLFSFN